MPSRIVAGFLVFCLALLLGAPMSVAKPNFAELLTRAQAEADAGRRWEPPGDNLADTIMDLFQLTPTATTEQLAAFSALLERDRKTLQEIPGASTAVPAAPPLGSAPLGGSAPPVAPPAPGSPVLGPPPVANPAPHQEARASDLFEHAQAAEQSGDISGARRYYASAAARGNKASALRLGRLYDPAFLGRTVIGGIDPDPVAARRWYERAAAQGDREAAPLLQALNGQ
jgi:TPR repeat protein